MVAIVKSETRSGLREFVSLLATVRGDLSTISAPPFLLAPQSLVEFPSYWAEHPSLFAAPALEPDPARRSLLVLKVWLSALKRQYYVGASSSTNLKAAGGIKKPLNPFLGEQFLGEWDDRKARTRVVSEQVSHHPPTTACYITDDEHGIHAQAHSTQSTTLTLSSGIPTVLIKQSGHAILHIDAYNEDYLLPLPDVRVKGLLSGAPYPELAGTYRIVSSSGFTSELFFSGRGWVSGSKNYFDATIFRTDDKLKTPVFTARGQWSDRFAFFSGDENEVIETYDVNKDVPAPLILPELEDQDPWESRRAWAKVIDTLKRGDYLAVVNEKAKIENAQRAMRRKEREAGSKWEAEYFRRVDTQSEMEALSNLVKGADVDRLTGSTGIWRYDSRKEEERRKRGIRGRGAREGTTPTG